MDSLPIGRQLLHYLEGLEYQFVAFMLNRDIAPSLQSNYDCISEQLLFCQRDAMGLLTAVLRNTQLLLFS